MVQVGFGDLVVQFRGGWGSMEGSIGVARW